MPEEINRVLTDQISALLFTTTERGALENLKHEGIGPLAALRRKRTRWTSTILSGSDQGNDLIVREIHRYLGLETALDGPFLPENGRLSVGCPADCVAEAGGQAARWSGRRSCP